MVGSSNWAINNILRFNGNRDLFLNMMNWLSSDEDLISIRPKDPEDRRLNISQPPNEHAILLQHDFPALDRCGLRLRGLVAQEMSE